MIIQIWYNMKERLKSLQKAKVIITLLQGLILLFCLTMQFSPSFRCSFNEFTCLHCIDKNLSGTFLQIDATLMTLTIALMAIMSGLISVSYMGISYTDFVLNIQPNRYSQKLIIKMSLIYLAIAVFSFWADWDYLIAGILFCELLLIYMSVLSIFCIFKGRKYLQDKIKNYSQAAQLGSRQFYQGGKARQEFSLQKDDNIIQNTTARDVQDRFIEAFGDILITGSENEYNDFIKTFLIITKGVWEKRNEKVTVYSLEQYQRNVSRLIHVCVKSRNPDSKLLALRLIDDIYEELSNCIRKSSAKNFTKRGVCQYEENSNKDIPNSNTGAGGKVQQFKLPRSLQLISSYDYKALLKKTDINELVKTVSIQRTLSNMNYVNMALFYEQCQEKVTWSSSATVLSIEAYLGQYIAEQKQKGNIPSMDYWSRTFWHTFVDPVHGTVIEEAKLPIYYKALANSGIMYICGLLAAGCFDIVQESLYKEILAYPISYNAAINRIVAAVHPFIYYMTSREEADCVGLELLAQAKTFWDTNAETYDSFIHNNDEITKLWIENLNTEYRTVFIGGKEQRKRDENSEWIYSLLQSFDFKMDSDKGGILTLPEAISDFCLFSILYKSYSAQLNWIEDDYHRVEDFIRYVQTDHENEVKKAIRGYVKFRMGKTLCPGKVKDEKIDAKTNEIFKQLVVGIKDLYRDKKVKEAREWQSDYLKKLDVIKGGMGNWEKELIKAVKETFGENICFFDDGNSKHYVITFSRFEAYTNDVESEFNENNITRFVECLIDAYIKLLIEQNCLAWANRNDFKDDQDYIYFLNNNQLNWLVGSDYLLMNKDYRMSEKFREATKDYKWIKNTGCSYAMAIRKESVRFYIKDITVNIRSAGIKDVDEVNGREGFEYEPVQGVKLQYKDNKELEEFIGQEKKVIEVTARIAVGVYGERPIGFYYTM